MKKYLFIRLMAATLLLAACNEKPVENTISSAEVIESVENEIDSERTSQPVSSNEVDFEEAVKVAEVTEFSGHPEVVEDNKNKRIIFWKENNVVCYKSIYFKDQQKVKVIETGKEGQIYYGGL